jgi:phosphonoacetaldehyde hydrolase
MSHLRKKIKYAILNFSGTIIDPYSLYSSTMLINTFARHKIDITSSETRKSMGLRKDVHINELLNDPYISRLWEETRGVYPSIQREGKMLFKEFNSEYFVLSEKFSKIIPGVENAINKLRDMNIKIGLTTGLDRKMVNIIDSSLKRQGIKLDCIVAGDEVLNGIKPYPHMLYKNLDILKVENINEVVKIGSTLKEIEEGKNAQCKTIGLSKYSHEVGIDSFSSLNEISEDKLSRKEEYSRQKMVNINPDAICDTLNDVPKIIKKWNEEKYEIGSKRNRYTSLYPPTHISESLIKIS